MKKIFSLALCLALIVTLTACGGSSGTVVNKSEPMMYAESPMAAPMEESAVMDMASGGSNTLKGSGSGSSSLPENRKWIITMDMNVETDDLDTLMEELDQKIGSLNGYVEDQNIHNGSSYASRRYRSANLTVRIPAQHVDQFTNEISGIANVISQNLRREDITLQYVATSSRITALETEQTRLLELLAEAENMSDLLEIESRLTDVRYELERYGSQLRLYDNQVDYATIYLSVSEVQEYTPVEEPTFLERIKTTFSDALEGLGESIVDITVFLVGNSPYLLTYGLIAFVIIRLMKRSGKTVKFRFPKRSKNNEQK